MSRIEKRTCFYCQQPGHVIKDCWLKQKDEAERSQLGSSRLGGRGQHTDRPRFNGRFSHGYESEQTFPRNASQRVRDSSSGDWNPAQGNSNFQEPSSDLMQSRFADAEQFVPPRSFMLKLAEVEETQNFEFCSKVAQTSLTKCDSAYIDSGATHHFFHSRKAFNNYKRIAPREVQAASAISTLVGKGNVWIPIGNGIKDESFHAPHLSSNIQSVGLLSSEYIVSFTDCIKPYNACFLMEKGSWRILMEAPRENGLYALRPPNSRTRAALTAAASPLKKDLPLEWHCRTGHLGADRYLQLSNQISSVPTFDRSILSQVQCVPCIQGKAKRSPVSRSTHRTSQPLELIHVDISGPVRPSLAGNRYTIVILDDYTAKSDVFMLKTKDETSSVLEMFRNRAQTELSGQVHLRRIRLDRAGENKAEDVQSFARKFGIKLEYSPAYASESNGSAERLIQEHWTRARVLLFASDLSLDVWGEAISHANWLRNRAPSSRLDGRIPILAWNPATEIDFSNVLEFGQKGHAFVYRPKTTPQKKLLPRTVFGHFVGMESDVTLLRVLVPATKKIIISRAPDFHVLNSEHLPSISTMLDGISRQMSFEDLNRSGNLNTDSETVDSEDQLISVFFLQPSTNRLFLFRERLFRILHSQGRLLVHVKTLTGQKLLTESSRHWLNEKHGPSFLVHPRCSLCPSHGSSG